MIFYQSRPVAGSEAGRAGRQPSRWDGDRRRRRPGRKSRPDTSTPRWRRISEQGAKRLRPRQQGDADARKIGPNSLAMNSDVVHSRASTIEFMTRAVAFLRIAVIAARQGRFGRGHGANRVKAAPLGRRDGSRRRPLGSKNSDREDLSKTALRAAAQRLKSLTGPHGAKGLSKRSTARCVDGSERASTRLGTLRARRVGRVGGHSVRRRERRALLAFLQGRKPYTAHGLASIGAITAGLSVPKTRDHRDAHDQRSPTHDFPPSRRRAVFLDGVSPAVRAATPGTPCAPISRGSSPACRSGRRLSWSSPRIGKRRGRPSASPPRRGCCYDYYGFPAHTYELSYPAPGEPKVAAEVKRLLERGGPAGRRERQARLRPRRVRADADRRSEGRDPGRHGLDRARPRSRRATSRSARRWRRCAIKASPSSAAA